MQKTLINTDVLLELTRERIDINSLVEELDKRDAFDEYSAEAALLNWKKIQVRRAIKKMKGSDGLPLIFSIVEIGQDGREIHKYKQEALFNIEEYKQAIEYCSQNRRYWRRMEDQLKRNARAKFADRSGLF